MSIALATFRIGAPDAPKTVAMLHGIYGRGRNWAAVAKGLVEARTDYTCELVDLPHHGSTGPGVHGDTVRGVAKDVAIWCEQQGLTLDALLGHSFGGKVALAMAEHWHDRPLDIWIVDSSPATREPSGSAWDLLQVVRRLPTAFETREAFVAALTGQGWAPAVAHWMATNLERTGDAFTWRLDLDAMERLIRDFYATDLWAVVERPVPGRTVHFIKATESNVMDDDAVRRAEAVGPHVRMHYLAGGHWIHAEEPEAVTALLAAALP